MDLITALIVNAIDARDNGILEQLLNRRLGVDLNLRIEGESTLLTKAISLKNNVAVKLLIDAGADVNMSCLLDQLHITPLLYAINDDNGETVRLLIAAGANVNDRVDGEGTTVMHYAVRLHKRQCVMALAQCDGLIDKPNNLGITPLCQAINNEDPIMASLLCDLGCDKEQENQNGCSALLFAVNTKNANCLQVLIEKGVDMNHFFRYEGESTVLTRAISLKNNIAVKLLINAGADVNMSCLSDNAHITPLQYAIDKDNDEAVRLLIAAGVNVNDGVDGEGNTVMHYAVQLHKRQCVMALAQCDGLIDKPNKDGVTPLDMAVNNEDAAMISLLCDLGCDKEQENENGSNALSLAVKLGNKMCMQALIDKGVDVNHNNPLLLAIKFNSKNILEVLAKSKASYLLQEESDHETRISIFNYIFCKTLPNEEMVIILIENYHGNELDDNAWQILLENLVKHGFLKAFDALCSKRSSSKIKQDIDKSLSLKCAAQHGNDNFVQKLLTVGADVNIFCEFKQTALMIAAYHGFHFVSEILINNGADIDAKDHRSSTALMMAVRNGHDLVAEQLIAANADVNLFDFLHQTALISSAINTNSKSLELLLNSSIDIDLDCYCGFRQIDAALFAAVKYSNSNSVDVLLRNPMVNVNAAHKDSSYAIIHYASKYRNALIIKSLINAGANVNCSNDDNHTHCHTQSPLHVAALFGNAAAAAALIECGADTSATCVHGFKASQISSYYGDDECFSCLQSQNSVTCDNGRSESSPDNVEFSRHLHLAMISSGFSRSRAVLQSATADVLQQIQAKREFNEHQFIVGSLGDGWGNSLRWLTGKTDPASDIDVTRFVPGKEYHIRGRCRCDGVAEDVKVQYDNGHVIVSGLASSPSIATFGTSERPAFDDVKAFRICNYPHMEVIHNHRRKSQFSPELLQSLRDEAERPNCHAVAAACPGMQGQQLRLSTTFLEKIVMRSLSTIQGQVFIILKFLIKKVLGGRGTGLKSYHAKCLLFNLLDQTPSAEWHSGNMVKLLLAGVQVLLDNLSVTQAADNECMRHFFLQDAAVFLKSRSITKEAITLEVKSVMMDMHTLLNGFKDNLRPCSELYFFHPFNYLLDIFNTFNASVNDDLTEFSFHEIYDAVRQCLLQLMDDNCDRNLVSCLIKRLPDCAATTRAALRVMLLLKFGERHEATVELVKHISRNQRVNRGLTQAAVDENEVTADFVLLHLQQTDSAWRFCFDFHREISLEFLPPNFKGFLLTQIETYKNYYFINFDSLMKFLMIELIGSKCFDINQYFHQILHNDDADVQEILLTLTFCNDLEIVQQVLKKQKDVIFGNEDLVNEAESTMELLEQVADWRNSDTDNQSIESRFENIHFLLIVLLIVIVAASCWQKEF